MGIDIAPKQMTDNFTAEKKRAIFNHPDCRKLFNERVADVRLSHSEELEDVYLSFKMLLKLIPFAELNISNEDFSSLVRVLSDMTADVHTKLIFFMIIQIRKAQPQYYLIHPEDLKEYHSTINATYEIEKQIEELTNPIEAAVIEEFWVNATITQMNDIERMLNGNKQMNKPIFKA